jgi:hypothetical protein
VFKFLAASIIGTLIVIGGQADTEPTSSPEPLPTIAYTWTNTPVGDTCDPDTTCEGLEADVEYTECWIEHKTDLPDELIQGDPKLMPASSTVVPCGTTTGYPQDDVAAERPVEYYGGTPGGAKCSTDAACSAYTRDKGGEYGYGGSPEKAEMWDGIPADQRQA